MERLKFLTWIIRYRCMSFLRSSLWAAPVACMAIAMVAAPLIRLVDDHTRWTLLNFGVEGARVVTGALASAILTFLVFSFSMMLLAVQFASAALSPLVIAWMFEGRLLKLVLGTFVFSFTYTLAVLGRIEDRVPQLPILISFLSSLASIVLFLYMIQSASQSLRQGAILSRVATHTRGVIQQVYLIPFASGEAVSSDTVLGAAQAQMTVTCSERSGSLVAFDLTGLVELARGAACAIELIPEVGDFVAIGENLFRLYGDGSGAVDQTLLADSVALGAERSLDQDPAFGFRILVDIAIKALSPAINDPTTAVLAIDQLHHLLHLLGTKKLDLGTVRDAGGEIRLVYRMPSWEDFVTLAVTEIRVFGGNSPQVTRRLKMMLEELLRVLPEERGSALRSQMAILQRTIEKSFINSEDCTLASVGDMQGFGSRQSTTAR